MDTSSEDLDRLTRHADFLRRLSRALAGPSLEAEDLEQEVWLAALRAGPLERPRAWMTAVARRLTGREALARGRRRAREEDSARAEALAPTDELAAELELAERLTAAVRALPEPLRTTLHLHYAEGLSAASIARRMDVPTETVRTRIKRGLALLRDDLERELQEDWRAALAPLASLTTLETARRGGLMALGWKLAASAATVACVVALWPDGEQEPARRESLEPSRASALREALVGTPPAEIPSEEARGSTQPPELRAAPDRPTPAVAAAERVEALPVGALAGRVFAAANLEPFPDLDRETLERTSGCAPPPGMDLTDRRLRIGPERGLRDVVIVVEARPRRDARVEEHPVRTLRMETGRFEPYILLAPAGARLALENLDAETYVVHAYSRRNPAFNVTVPFGSPYERRFALEREESFELKDDLRPWMSAWVHVDHSPFVARTDERGAFRIEGLPPGRHKLRAWHPTLGKLKVRAKLRVLEDETAKVLLELDERHRRLDERKEKPPR